MSEIKGGAITTKDIIFSNNSDIHSAGFSVNSIMMKSGLSSDIFDNLVVPNWVWSLNDQTEENQEKKGGMPKYHIKDEDEEQDEDIIEDDLYNKLLELATENMKSNKTPNKKNKAETKKRKMKHKNNRTKKKKGK